MGLSFIVNTLRSNIIVQIIICGILTFIILINYKKFILWIIFLPYSGIWLYHLNSPYESGYRRELMYLSSYLELLLVSFFMWRWFLIENKDKMSFWLLMMPTWAIPSLINSDGHFGLSLFIIVCLFCGAGVYRFFLDYMEKIESSRLVDITLLILLILGLAIKVYAGVRLEQSYLVQRGGGILGSNTIAISIFLLLPLVKNRWLTFTTILFLIIQFSKGIYIALCVYALLHMLFVNARKTLKFTVPILLIVSALISSAKNISINAGNMTYSLFYFICARLRLQGDFSPTGVLSDFWAGVINSDRLKIWSVAIDVIKNNGLIGIGPGGTTWELIKIDFTHIYSNFHNMFLTSLVECGLVFTICFAGFIVYLLIRSFFVCRPVFVGLSTWVFYQMYTGNLYIAAGLPTAGIYYVFLFVVAYIVYVDRKLKNQKQADSTLRISYNASSVVAR